MNGWREEEEEERKEANLVITATRVMLISAHQVGQAISVVDFSIERFQWHELFKVVLQVYMYVRASTSACQVMQV